MRLFELEAVGGPLAKRLARRRQGTEHLAWGELAPLATTPAGEHARGVWTQSAFSEYASAASFADITGGLLAAGAPIDLCAAAGDFVLDEILHAELSSQIAMTLGGAVPLEVDLARLVRPPTSDTPLARVAELVVRTCCVGESLTIALLQASRESAGAPVIAEVIGRIVRDEAEHAELGWTFLDWAADRLSDDELSALGQVATGAVASFAPVFMRECAGDGSLGVMSCATYDAAFVKALQRRVDEPLRARGIEIAPDVLEHITALARG